MPQSEMMYMQYIHSVYTTTGFGTQYGHARVMGWDDGTEEDAKRRITSGQAEEGDRRGVYADEVCVYRPEVCKAGILKLLSSLRGKRRTATMRRASRSERENQHTVTWKGSPTPTWEREPITRPRGDTG